MSLDIDHAGVFYSRTRDSISRSVDRCIRRSVGHQKAVLLGLLPLAHPYATDAQWPIGLRVEFTYTPTPPGEYSFSYLILVHLFEFDV